jgi:hypothetical protein
MNKVNKLLDKRIIVFGFFLISLCYSIYNLQQNWNESLTDQHTFRQSQTAITAYYFKKDGLALGYITPILGPSWQIPFEFPTYQAIVALFSKYVGYPLEQCGRLVSVMFWAGVLVFCYNLLRLFHFTSWQSLFLVSIILWSPVYNFWARTFMIETTALFFSFGFLYYAILFVKRRSLVILLIAILMASIASLTKVTTFSVYWVAFGIYFLIFSYSNKNNWDYRLWLLILLLMIFPVCLTKIWVDYCDHLKELTLQGETLMSKALTTWNYGTLDQKLSWKVWRQIFNFSFLKWTYLLPFLFLFKLKYWKWVVTLSLIWLSGPLIFTNLYYIHNYYATANHIVYMLIIGLVILQLIESKFSYFKLVGIAILPFLVYKFYYNYDLYFKNSTDLAEIHIKDVSSRIGNLINEEDILISFGDGWSPRIPYFSQRKTINWHTLPKTTEMLTIIKNLLGKQAIKGVVIYGRQAESNEIALIKSLDFKRKVLYSYDKQDFIEFYY